MCIVEVFVEQQNLQASWWFAVLQANAGAQRLCFEHISVVQRGNKMLHQKG